MKCHGAGGWFIGIACNTLHTFLPYIEKPFPITNIVSGVREYIETQRFKRVLVLGTERTIEQGLYEVCAPCILIPSQIEQQQASLVIDRILAGRYQDCDRDLLTQIMEGYLLRGFADAVVLGCTELSVLFRNAESRHIIDPLKLLARQLLKGVCPNLQESALLRLK